MASSHDSRGSSTLRGRLAGLFRRATPPPQDADADADADAAARVSRNWEALARHDPLWAIVSTPGKQGNRWGTEEFFATGAVEVQHVMNLLARLQLAPARAAALDFGAGVGRLTQALATHFERVDGVDISPTMLAQARSYNRHGDRVRYLQGEPDRLPVPDASYDFVLSRIVLQHLPAEMQRRYLAEFMRVLRPGGFAVAQVVNGARTSNETVFRSPVETGDGLATIDMNILPRLDVEKAIVAGGGRVLHTVSDRSAGESYDSNLFVVGR